MLNEPRTIKRIEFFISRFPPKGGVVSCSIPPVDTSAIDPGC